MLNEEEMLKLIELNKLYVTLHRGFDIGTAKRKWFKLSCGKGEEKIEFYVLEGSPIKALIIANYGLCNVKLFDYTGRLIHTQDKLPEKEEDY